MLIVGGAQPRHGNSDFFEISGRRWTESATLPVNITSFSMNYAETEQKAFIFGGFTGKRASNTGMYNKPLLNMRAHFYTPIFFFKNFFIKNIQKFA